MELLILAIVFITIGGGALVRCVYESDSSIDYKLLIYLVSIAFIIFGLLLLWLGVKAIHNDRKLNKKLGGMEYKFDYEKEFKIYKSIGSMERKNGEYYFGKYTDWKAYVEQQYINLINNENFYRYLYREYRNVKKEDSVDKCVMIPIVLLLSQIVISLNEWSFSWKIIIEFIILSIAEVFLICKIHAVNNRINFLEDFIEIIYPEKAMRK